MRVLFLTYPHTGLYSGGMEIQMAETANALRECGVDVVLYDPWRDDIPAVDICHLFSLDGSMSRHVERAQQLGKPIVISPVFNSFDEAAVTLRFKTALSQRVPGMRDGLARSRRILLSASRVIALNQEERSLLARAFGMRPDICSIIPNGVDRRLMQGDSRLAHGKYGVRDFVFQVGTVIPRKNQLTLVRVASRLHVPLLIVGGVGDPQYMSECVAAADANVIFTGEMQHSDPLLASIFACGKVFVLPSFSEVMPLSLYEAAAAGCRLIASRNFPVDEKISPFVARVDPSNADELAKLIARELRKERDDVLRETAATLPTWSEVGLRVRRAYEGVLRG